MNITLLGIGNGGGALADNLEKLGHQGTIAARARSSETAQAAQVQNSTLVAKPAQEIVDETEVVFLATPFPANGAVLTSAGPLTRKIVVDCTNPINAGLNHSLNSKTFGGETAQTCVPTAKVVKAFSISGYENFSYENFKNVAYLGYQASAYLGHQTGAYLGHQASNTALKPAMLTVGG